jgi:hypothetical protein
MVINRSYREREILLLIDISDLNIYHKLSEQLKQSFIDCDEKTEVIASDFRSSHDSFIAGDFKKAIEYSYICLEGLNRLLNWKKGIELTRTKYQRDYKQVRHWRNKVAHSSVSKKEVTNDKKEKIGYTQAFTAIKTTNEILSNVVGIIMHTNLINEYERLAEEERKRLQTAISSELEPFLNGVKELEKTSQMYQNFRNAYIVYKSQVQDKKQLFSSMLPTKFDVANLKDNLYSLFLYLGLVESVGTKIVDILVLLLVANGHNFEYKGREKVTMQQLEYSENN